MSRPSPSTVRRVRHRLRALASEHPAVYLPFARHKYPGPSPQVIGPDTELVIDGYTRSATTFAVYALQLSQKRPVRLAHHLHAPAQLIAAAQRGVPALALIRQPKGALLSQLIREPDVVLSDALLAYSRFYECLLGCRERLVVAEFEAVTGEFGAVTRRVNERFGTHFDEFVHTTAAVDECFDLVKRRGTLSSTLLGFESGLVSLQELRADLESRPQPGLVDSKEAWVPSKERQGTKKALDEQWERPELADLKRRAQLAYETFLEEPVVGRGAPAPASRAAAPGR